MIIFKRDVAVKDTMLFEEYFPDVLALDLEDKREVLKTAIARWMFVDGILAGETYGHKVRDVDEPVPGVTDADLRLDSRWHADKTFYVYTTGTLKPYQRQGYAKILKAHTLGVVSGLGFATVIGHSTENGSIQLNQSVGADVIGEYPNWLGSGHTYFMYRINLRD